MARLNRKPKISVVVRAHNEEKSLVFALRSLGNQKEVSPSVYEVIVVDNASTDKTAAVAQNFLKNNPRFHGRIVYEPQKGRGQALHRGVLEANADLVAFLDADSEAEANWLAGIIGLMEIDPEIAVGSGQVEFGNGPWYHRFLYLLARSLVYSLAARLNQGWISGANWWVRKKAYYQTGGIVDLSPEVINDDKIMAIRLRRQGRIAYFRGARVRTDNWLIKKSTWLTDLPNEFEQVRQIINVPKSFLHRLTEKISFILSKWDRTKEKIYALTR